MTADVNGKRIETLIADEKWEEAQKAIQNRLAETPDDHWLRSRLSCVKYEQRDYKGALDAAQRALAIVPDCPLALWDQANALDMLGRTREAGRVYSRLLRRGFQEIKEPDEDAEECWEGEQWTWALVVDCIFRIAGCLAKTDAPDEAVVFYQSFLFFLRHGVQGIYTVEDGMAALRKLMPDKEKIDEEMVDKENALGKVLEELNATDGHFFGFDLPNLFQFATKELSHDAFFCWLLSWADRKYLATNEELHKTGVELMNRLLKSGKIEEPPHEYEDLKIHKQYKGIDILARINDKIALVIEDKKLTKEHSNQLRRYPEIVKQDFPGIKKLALVYLKIGNPSANEEKVVKKAGFVLFRRQDLLAVLEGEENLGVKSNIFRDYFCWLRLFDQLVDRLAGGKRLYTVSRLATLSYEDQIELVMKENNITRDKKVKASMLKSLPIGGKQFMPSSRDVMFDPQVHASSDINILKHCKTLIPHRLRSDPDPKNKKDNWYYLP